MYEIPVFPEFVQLSFEHKPIISELLALKGVNSSDFAFYNLWAWYNEKPAQISRIDKHLIISVEGPRGDYIFLPPLGEGPIDKPLQAILSYLALRGDKPVLSYVPKAIKDEIETAMSGCKCEPQRNDFDYLYNRHELAELSGRKFHQKKNFVNRIRDELNPIIERLTPALTPEVNDYLNTWYSAFGENDETMRIEAMAASRALPVLDALGGIGLVVRVKGMIAGVSLASPVHSRCWVVTLEKADRSIKGLYQFLNWALVNQLPPEVTLINRETDLGIEGLRSAKLSYHPCGFEEKFTIWF